MAKKKTHICICLDQSGSMAATRLQVLSGYNETIQQAKKSAQEPDHEVRVSLVTFTDEVYEHFWDRPAQECMEAGDKDFQPDGWTAFRDGLGYCARKIAKTVSLEGKEDACLVIVISDGMENQSKHVSPAALREVVKGLQDKGKTTFSYMGFSKDVVQSVAQETGIPVANMAAWDNRSSLRAATGMQGMSAGYGRYMAARSMGAVQTNSLYSADPVACADFAGDAGPDVSALLPSATVQTASAPLAFTSSKTVDWNAVY